MTAHCLPNARQRKNLRTTHEVEQATRSSDEKITTASELIDLITNGSTAISDTWAQHGSIAQPTSFIKDLAAELTGGSDDEDQWLGAHTLTSSIKTHSKVGTRCRKLLDFAHELRDARDEESSSLARACGLVSRGMMNTAFKATHQSAQHRSYHGLSRRLG